MADLFDATLAAQVRGRLVDWPAGPFDIIYADPPWKFSSNSKAKPGRNAMRHYETMTVPEIMAMPVEEIAAPQALLFLWVTVPHLANGMDTASRWGFKYVSSFVWPKQRIATGYWIRNRHEIVLLCKRGRFPRPDGKAPFPDSVLDGEQREHSRKPIGLKDHIDDLWPQARRVELFARSDRDGWTCWGDEVGKFGKEQRNGAET